MLSAQVLNQHCDCLRNVWGSEVSMLGCRQLSGDNCMFHFDCWAVEHKFHVELGPVTFVMLS